MRKAAILLSLVVLSVSAISQPVDQTEDHALFSQDSTAGIISELKRLQDTCDSSEATPSEATPSPSGKTYVVILLATAAEDSTQPSVLSTQLDFWRFGSDQSFESLYFGRGGWTLDLIGAVSALWHWNIGGGFVFTNFSGISFPTSGRLLVASGVYFVDPSAILLRGLGVQVGSDCLVESVVP